MRLSARWLYARSAWNRAWLWDVGALLSLLNGGVLTQVAGEHGLLYPPIVGFAGGFGATFLGFLTADRMGSGWLPVVSDTGHYQLLVSTAIVAPFFASAALGATLLRPERALEELSLVLLGNAAALTASALVVTYYSRDSA